jgi:hypothetical protein
MSKARISTIATFPPGFFLENLCSFGDGDLLITVLNRGELYHLHPEGNSKVAPMLVDKFPADQFAMGITRAPQNANVCYVVTTDFLGMGSKKSYLHVIDTSNPAMGCRPRSIVEFPPETRGLNGLCALSDTVLLAADSFASCIWRIDIEHSLFPPKSAFVSKWFSDTTMAGDLVLPDFQPGTNGLKYSAKTGYVYYTSTQKRLFCRVKVDSGSLEPAGAVDIVSRGMQGDDFIVDDTSSEPVAYLTTHRDNSLLKIPLNQDSEVHLQDLDVIAGVSGTDNTILGPTAGTWEAGKEGKVAYFTTDGGLKNLPRDGIARCARVIRVEF